MGLTVSYDNQELRMTIWPGVPLPLPPLLPRRGHYSLDATKQALVGTGGWEEIEHADRREIYLKLYALDLDDPEAIISFANSFGAPSGELVHTALRNHSWFAELFSSDEDRLVTETVRADPSLRERMDITHPDWELIEVVTLNSFSFAAQVLGDLTDAWRIANLDPKLDRGQHRWRLPYPGDPAPDDRFFASQLLSNGLTPLLAGHRPYLGGTPEPADETPAPTPEPEPAGPNKGVHLEAARSTNFAHLAQHCALELFNDIVRGDVYRICQNQNCGKTFVLQYGRQEHGMSKREGVMYCTVHCAQATAARAYRARKKAKLSQARNQQSAQKRAEAK